MQHCVPVRAGYITMDSINAYLEDHLYQAYRDGGRARNELASAYWRSPTYWRRIRELNALQSARFSFCCGYFQEVSDYFDACVAAALEAAANGNACADRTRNDVDKFDGYRTLLISYC